MRMSYTDAGGCLNVREADKHAAAKKGLVVGLGSGALALYLHWHMGMDVKAVELDAAVVGLAEQHFEFSTKEGLEVGLIPFKRSMCSTQHALPQMQRYTQMRQILLQLDKAASRGDDNQPYKVHKRISGFQKLFVFGRW